MAPQTDEEQLENIRKWWQENGSTIVIGLVIGLGTFGGWRFWQNYQQTQAEDASSQYERVLESTKQPEQAGIEINAGDLRDKHPSSPYASFAALLLAKHNAQNDQADNGEQNLNWVSQNASIPEVKQIAAWRRARLLLSQNKPGEALAIAEGIEPESVFLDAFEELKGDIYTVQGKLQDARLAYDKVLSGDELSQQHRIWVQLKRDDLGTPSLPAVADAIGNADASVSQAAEITSTATLDDALAEPSEDKTVDVDVKTEVETAPTESDNQADAQ